MRLLVVSPHMDDETLGAGGLILKYTQAGEAAYWLNISNTDVKYGYTQQMVDKRQRQMEQVAAGLGVKEVVDMKLKPAALSEYPEAEIIGELGQTIRRIAPEVLVTAFPGDIHSDHQVVFNWIKAFSKSFRLPSLRRFMVMEVVSETDFSLADHPFTPNYYVDITDQMERKLELLQIYEDEIGQHPFPRSIENIKALATSRGVVAGTRYAEAFMLLREIEK